MMGLQREAAEVSFPSDKCRLHLQLRGRKKVASRKNVSKFSFSDLRVKKRSILSTVATHSCYFLMLGGLTGRILVIWGITLEGHGPTPRFPEDSGLSHLRGMLKETFYT